MVPLSLQRPSSLWGQLGRLAPSTPVSQKWYSQAEVHLANTKNFMQAVVDAIKADDVGALPSASQRSTTNKLSASVPTSLRRTRR